MKIGDMKYKILCCDYKKYLGYIEDSSVNLFVLDPPFGIGEEKFGKQYNRKEDNVIENYFPGVESYYEGKIRCLLQECYKKLKDNGSIILFCAGNNLKKVLISVERAEFEIINHLIGHYNFGVYTKHKFVNSHYHILGLAKKGHKPYFNQFGVHSTTKESYKDLQDVLIFKKEFQHGGKKNINKLPSKLVEHLIKLTTKKGDVVCDLFAGSFIVPKTAEKLGRIGIGCEINPKCFFDTELTKSDLDEIKQTFSKAYHEGDEKDYENLPTFNYVLFRIKNNEWQETIENGSIFYMGKKIVENYKNKSNEGDMILDSTDDRVMELKKGKKVL